MWYWSMRRNIMKEGGLSDLTLFVGRGVLLCRKIVQLLALLLELDHFAPLKADAGLTTVRQHGVNTTVGAESICTEFTPQVGYSAKKAHHG
ncbi:hypothetical protein HID58_080981 [Brassica napus]|uniref:Uncharacterized protein n=1 Tax=Brassica napus TaxID=3708 RepID=A0ABQ7Y6G5_BRANA|nr:hypothetical protein HID58_080981 [Brassica napus]